MSHRILSTVLILGCTPPDPPAPSPSPADEPSSPTTEVTSPSSEPETTTTTTTTPPCTVSLVSSTPADGDDQVYYRAPVRVVLSDPDPTAVVTIAGADG